MTPPNCKACNDTGIIRSTHVGGDHGAPTAFFCNQCPPKGIKADVIILDEVGPAPQSRPARPRWYMERVDKAVEMQDAGDKRSINEIMSDLAAADADRAKNAADEPKDYCSCLNGRTCELHGGLPPAANV